MWWICRHSFLRWFCWLSLASHAALLSVGRAEIRLTFRAKNCWATFDECGWISSRQRCPGSSFKKPVHFSLLLKLNLTTAEPCMGSRVVRIGSLCFLTSGHRRHRGHPVSQRSQQKPTINCPVSLRWLAAAGEVSGKNLLSSKNRRFVYVCAYKM